MLLRKVNFLFFLKECLRKMNKTGLLRFYELYLPNIHIPTLYVFDVRTECVYTNRSFVLRFYEVYVWRNIGYTSNCP